jgi:hypothetical protein
MPTFQFEAMDATGQEIKDIIEASNEEEAQTTIRQMGYFVTKIQVKKGGCQGSSWAEEEASLCHRWGQDQAHLRLHPTAVDSPRRRSADSPQLEDPGEQQQAGQAQECADGYVR